MLIKYTYTHTQTHAQAHNLMHSNGCLFLFLSSKLKTIVLLASLLGLWLKVVVL